MHLKAVLWIRFILTDPVSMITDPDPGRILTKIQSFEISQLFFERKILWISFVYQKNALNTQILEHLEEI